MEIMTDQELANSKKFLQELKDHEARMLDEAIKNGFDKEQISIILSPLECFRAGVEDDIKEYESKVKK